MKLRKLGSNMDTLGGHLSDRPCSVGDAQKYFHMGEQSSKDVLERLAERGIARRDGSMQFVRGPKWDDYAPLYNWV